MEGTPPRGGWRRALARPLEGWAYRGAGTLIGASKSRYFSQWLGAFAAIAAVLGGFSLLFPAAPFANTRLAGLDVALVAVFALVFLSRRLENAPLNFFSGAFVVATLLVSVGVYAGGSPASGAQFFYIWVTSLAFAFLSPRQAQLQLGFLGLSYAGVLVLQHHQHPAIGSGGLLIGMWLTTLVSCLVVGEFVRRISKRLRELARRLQRAFLDSPVGSGFLTQELIFTDVNPSLATMLGHGRDQILGRPMAEFLEDDDRAVATAIAAEVAGGGTLRRELRLGSGSDWISVSVSAALLTPELGDPYVFMQFVDITDHVRDRDALAHRAIHDQLTGLFNRAVLMDRLATALRHRTEESEVAILLLDLDQFKLVNDSLGHEVGDDLLAALAPRFAAAIRREDTLARFGGDEFVVLCEGISSPFDALGRASALADAMRAPIKLGSGEYRASGSIGVAISSSMTDDGPGLLRDADAAMYRAKAIGRDRIEMFDQSMREAAIARLDLERALSLATERNEIVLEFQPVVDLPSGSVVFFEALARWNHPVRGTLQPREFISLAEETGLISGIGRSVLESAVRYLAEWQGAFPGQRFGVTVNVSGRQLQDPGFVDLVARTIRAHGIAPHTLGLEITESVLLGRSLQPQVLEDLRALGVVLLLDDFGTGYSSLAYLEQFTVDVLKVDHSFVARLDEGAHRNVVLEAILQMARALEIQVIAEGAEDAERIRTLRALGCVWVQGFGICPPLTPDRVPLYLTELGAISDALGRGGPATL